MATRTAYAPVVGEVLTSANMVRLPGGWLGYVEATANQGGIGASAVDLTSLSVTVTVGASRRIRLLAAVQPASTVGADVPTVYLVEGATQLQSRSVTLAGVGISTALVGQVILTPSTGAHTYKVQMNLAVGSGVITNNAAANSPSFLLVEDIGPA